MTKKSKKIATLGLTSLTAIALTFGTGFLTVGAAEDPSPDVSPIARYEFKNDYNIGKDSMGNYDMSIGYAYDGSGPRGHGVLMDDFTVVDGGGVEWDSNFCLHQEHDNDMFKDLTAFTWAFEMKTVAGTNVHPWGNVLGLGNDDTHAFFVSPTNGTAGTAGLHAAGTSSEISNDLYWGLASLDNSGNFTDYHKVVISAQPGGELNAWVDGTKVTGKLPATLPENWSPYAGAGQDPASATFSTFSIGAYWNGNAVYASAGGLKNLCIYNFAVDEAAAQAWTTNGKLTEKDTATCKQVTAVSVGSGVAASDLGLNSSMSTRDMLAALNPATATVTITGDKQVTCPIEWTSVTKEGDQYFANGKVDISKSGAVIPATLTSQLTVKQEITVTGVKSISEPVFEGGSVTTEAVTDDVSKSDILEKVASATVTVTYTDDSTKEGTVEWKSIEQSLGEYYVVGTVKVEDAGVGTVRVQVPVEACTEGKEWAVLDPIAKYTFDSEETKMKDSMGHYDLQALPVPVEQKPSDPSVADLDMFGTGQVTEKGIYFDGVSMLGLPMLNDISDNLSNGFTVNFQYQQDGLFKPYQDWSAPVSFGFNDWNRTTVLDFMIEGNSTLLRVNAHQMTNNYPGSGDLYHGLGICQDGTDRMHNVSCSVRPGEKLRVYVDGKEVVTIDCPAGWSTKHDNSTFAIGGASAWAYGYSPFKGWVDNVTVYPFAQTLEQNNQYWAKGRVIVGDMDGEVITELSDTPAWEKDEVLKDDSKTLNDNLKPTQAINRVNNATVDGLFINGKSIKIPVTWTGYELRGAKYYMVGVVDASNLGYATTLTGSTTVYAEIEMTRVKRDIIVDGSIKNGTVTVDKDSAYLGDSVTVTIAPNEGYELKELLVNEEKVTVTGNTYTFTIEGQGSYSILASFVEAGSGSQGGTEGGGSQSGGTSEGGNGGGCGSAISYAGMGILLCAAAVVTLGVLVSRKKNENK